MTTALKPILRQFIGPAQLRALAYCLRSEEAPFFQDMLSDLASRIETMPVTYAQDGMGNAAVIHLHYFTGGCNWWITEKDIETPDEPGQHQAFGLASLGYEPELGYISIVELLANGAELDLYWTPITIGQLTAKREGRAS